MLAIPATVTALPTAAITVVPYPVGEHAGQR